MNIKKIIALGLLCTTGIAGVHNVCGAYWDTSGKLKSSGKYSNSQMMHAGFNHFRNYRAIATDATDAQNSRTIKRLLGERFLEAWNIVEITVECTDDHKQLSAMDSLGVLLSAQLIDALTASGHTTTGRTLRQTYDSEFIRSILNDQYGEGTYVLLTEEPSLITHNSIITYTPATLDFIKEKHRKQFLRLFIIHKGRLYAAFSPRRDKGCCKCCRCCLSLPPEAAGIEIVDGSSVYKS